MSESRPPRDEPPGSGKAFLRELWEHGRETADKQQQVADAVKARKRGKTRDQLASIFKQEMRRYGVPPDPIWVEQELDTLEMSAVQRARRAAQALRHAPGALAQIGSKEGLLESLDSDADDRQPEWMRPPPDAVYPGLSRDSEKTPVTLDASTEPYLDDVFANAPDRVGPLALVDVWFVPTGTSSSATEVVVNIGQQRVGVLDADASERFMATVEAAATRGMKPSQNATLMTTPHHQPPYLLVVEVPQG